MEKTLEKLMREIQEDKKEYLMIGGNYNARTESEGRPAETGGRKEEKTGGQ